MFFLKFVAPSLRDIQDTYLLLNLKEAKRPYLVANHFIEEVFVIKM